VVLEEGRAVLERRRRDEDVLSCSSTTDEGARHGDAETNELAAGRKVAFGGERGPLDAAVFAPEQAGVEVGEAEEANDAVEAPESDGRVDVLEVRVCCSRWRLWVSTILCWKC
jgi:hypothetical protein